MKKLLTILFLLPFSLYAQNTYYVATNGNNGNPGTYAEPWATFTYAADNIAGGDTVYFMGGTYYPTTQVEINSDVNGTYEKHTTFIGYPGDTVIFDFVNYDEASNFAQAIYITQAGYLTFKDFEIKNVEQKQQYTEVTAVYSQYGHNLYFENISVHDCGGRGFMHETAVGYYGITSDTTFFINCDSYNNADSLQYTSGAVLGNQSDGFKTYGEPGAYIVYRGCRAWNNSDDGYDLGNNATIIIDNCWAFQNGKILEGDGEGFKTGGLTVEETGIRRVIKNCIAAENDFSGFRLLEYEGYYRTNAKFYNNLSYKNYGSGGSGFGMDDNFDEPTVLAAWRNNIAYKNFYGGDPEMDRPFSNAYQTYTESNNSWEYVEGYPGWVWNIEPTDADFVSLDVEELKNPRKTDGALPDVMFGKLTRTSNFINAGTTNITDINTLPYVDAIAYVNTPDIGYAEFQPIIADHTVVELYDDIPQQWIDSVKTMLVNIGGMSHSLGYFHGMDLLEEYDDTYQVLTWLTETPPAESDAYLRIGRPYMYGVSSWTSQTGINTITGINEGQATAGNPYDVFGIGWCYDMTWVNDPGGTEDPVYGVRWAGSSEGGADGDKQWGLDAGDSVLVGNRVYMDKYLAAINAYNTHAISNDYPTLSIFTTGPVDGYVGTENGFQRELKQQHIRDYVEEDETRILFDYADILCYSDSGDLYTVNWDDGGNLRDYNQLHPDNQMDYDASWNLIESENLGDEDHIGEVGTLRLAKAMWWTLARIAGWDGVSTLSASPEQIDSTATDILTFTLSAQTGTTTINSTNHTVAIEVEYGTSVTALQPTITVSEGATISPTSGTATNFTSPVVYTVTALDESTQEWTVTVTIASAPETPTGGFMGSGGSFMKSGNVFMK